MNNLLGIQKSSNLLFHYKSVFKNIILTVFMRMIRRKDQNISAAINNFPLKIWMIFTRPLRHFSAFHFRRIPKSALIPWSKTNFCFTHFFFDTVSFGNICITPLERCIYGRFQKTFFGAKFSFQAIRKKVFSAILAKQQSHTI